MRRARTSRRLDGLFFVWAMSVVFMAASFVRVIGDAGSALLGGAVMEAILEQSIWGTRLGFEVIQFVGALVLLHTLLAVASWVMARVTLVAWADCPNSQRVLAVFWFVVFVIWIMTANAYWYPRTSLGNPYDHIAQAIIGGVSVFSIVSVVLTAALLSVVVIAVFRGFGDRLRSRVVWVGAAACLAAGAALPAIDVVGGAGGNAEFDRPHIILIGIDSLRTDFVQNTEQEWTPAIDEFFNESVSFSNAYTPLARTFPAWVSIVSGRHPHTTGAFVNLLPRELINEGRTLPSVLAENGYRTVYAIDEVRFSNLDTSYGFDEMLAPRMGAADFLLGFFADTPLANITVNTFVGGWLFPYGYANRAAANIYNPDTFIERIESGVDFDELTMLAVHFTLTHWPYTWATYPGEENPGNGRLTKEQRTRLRYELAVERVDQQFKRLMVLLDDKGALKNAIVVVLSDHGESLGEESPLAQLDESHDGTLKTDPLFGHGTHVFSADQYNVILGMRTYGNDLIASGRGEVFSVPVTLEDLAPTILDILDLNENQSFDGQSLLPFLNNQGQVSTEIANRIRFLETEFNPPGISPGTMLTSSAIDKAADKYRIDPDSNLVHVRAEFLDEILAKRQYAAELDRTILATLPAANYKEQHIVYYDPQRGVTDWLDQPPTAIDDPMLYRLWTALESRFSQVRKRPVVPMPIVTDEHQ